MPFRDIVVISMVVCAKRLAASSHLAGEGPKFVLEMLDRVVVLCLGLT